MKFFAELQITIDADRERLRKEELERQEAEKENEQTEPVKEKPKGKTKKERKKEAKPKVESPVDSEVSNANRLDHESKKRTNSILKIFFYLFLLWVIFAVSVIFTIARSPQTIEDLIAKMPMSFQATLLYHLEKVQQEIWKYLK